jgi:hypothetical protein
MCICSDHGTEFKAELDAWCNQYGNIGSIVLLIFLNRTEEQNLLTGI